MCLVPWRDRGPHTVDFRDHARAGNRLTNAIGNAMRALQQARSARRMREQLASMDDSLLVDIGIETDEIVRVRNGERFTPRRWQEQISGRKLSPRR